MSDSRNQITDKEATLNNFVGRYSWAPHWEAEVTTAVEGLDHQTLTAERFGGSSATVSKIADANKYQIEATSELKTLERPKVESAGLYPVRFELIHEDKLVICAMARHLLFRKSFKRDRWPNHDEDSIARKSKPLVSQVSNLSFARREKLWLDALKSERERETFWIGSILVALSDPRIASSIETYNQNRATVAANAA